MSIRYRDAGVDIDAGEALVQRIGPLAKATHIPGVLGDLGGFAGLFQVPGGMRDPVLVSGTDGVGTKLKVAFATGVHDTVGIDLVAMCVNDIATTGARPLFFLDYFGTGGLDVDVAEAVVSGIAQGCKIAGCALLGGETAELPGMYAAGEYDLAGFAVGIVERDALLHPSKVESGDVIVGVASSGLHSNGYSLARRVFIDELKLGFDDPFAAEQDALGAALLEPTRIYARAIAALLAACPQSVHGMAHITGGGLRDNIPRALPDHLAAHIDLGSYQRPALFTALASGGPVDEDEMQRTFNLGVGLVVIVSQADAPRAIDSLNQAGEKAWSLGVVHERSDSPIVLS
jgi:phosphoribosylformylglycinamidine cyclo-ligase